MSAGFGVAVRVDVNPKTGLGHFRRCVTLADGLRDAGFTICLVCAERPTPDVALLAGSHAILSFDKAPLGAPADKELRDAQDTLCVIERSGVHFSWVVVDSYDLGSRWEKVLRDAGLRVMAIDDFRNRMHHADVLVSDQDLPFDPAFNECAAFAQALTGWQYALIGPEFGYVRRHGPSDGVPRTLMIAYGGADPTGETSKALAAVRLLRKRPVADGRLGQVDVVVGHLNPHAGEIARITREMRGVATHVAPPGLAALMAAADLVLTAGGNTLVEALSLRKPCLVTVAADNQDGMVRRLAAEKVIRSLGEHHGVTAEGLADAIAEILANYENFATQAASRQLFDHLGAQRIAATMLNWQAAAAR